MATLKMDGIRHWRFTPNGGSPAMIEMQNTDFAVVYSASKSGDTVELGLELRFAWEHTDLALGKGRPRRVYLEERLKTLMWTYVGKKGTLVIDVALAEVKTLTDITLVGIQPIAGEENNIMEFSLQFAYPIAGTGGGIEIARTFQFGENADLDKVAVTADTLLVEYNIEDRTTFTPIWRAAPIRIENGPGLKSIRIFGIKQANTGGSALAKRQNNEAIIKNWTWSNKGADRRLFIDAVDLGIVHLREVQVGALDLADAVTYELLFHTGYGNG